MQASCTYGSVRGAPSNGRSYRDMLEGGRCNAAALLHNCSFTQIEIRSTSSSVISSPVRSQSFVVRGLSLSCAFSSVPPGSL
jgi:hypothetical protein